MVILGTKKRWCKLKFNGVDGVGLTEKTILKKNWWICHGDIKGRKNWQQPVQRPCGRNVTIQQCVEVIGREGERLRSKKINWEKQGRADHLRPLWLHWVHLDNLRYSFHSKIVNLITSAKYHLPCEVASSNIWGVGKWTSVRNNCLAYRRCSRKLWDGMHWPGQWVERGNRKVNLWTGEHSSRKCWRKGK